MMQRDELVNYLHTYLHTADFSDLCPNGLQVEGRHQVKHIVTGVSACVELFEKAVQKKADAVLVHHGIIWNFERPVYKGGYKKRVKMLLENDINLLGYHLPLDAHPEVGNNAQIANILNMDTIEPFGEMKGQYIGFKGTVADYTADTLFARIRDNINSHALIFPFGPERIRHIGVISGGAQKEVKQAVLQGLDAFITGEVSEHIMHYVKEEGIHFISAGHHASERVGIIALGRHLQEKFDVQVEFIDIPNPV
ncbi:MAG: Nif3-like dinuclear metal center hexameric protein [Caldithrix sp.]|nr:Nif3-like dinuclear metal center hexameric protein [Caldithrix sp.]